MIIIKSAETNLTTNIVEMEIEVNGQMMNASMPYETAHAFKEYVLSDYDDRIKKHKRAMKLAAIQMIIWTLLLIFLVIDIIVSTK